MSERSERIISTVHPGRRRSTGCPADRPPAPARAPRRWGPARVPPRPSCSASWARCCACPRPTPPRWPSEAPDADEQTMILNMGPQHPSTHGVLRLMLELQGEEVLRTKPIIGYLHTGMEKTAETLTYLQGATNTTRMDYAAPLFNELVFALATETLLGIEERHPAPGPVDPHAAVRAEPHVVPPAVPRHQRHGPRRGVDDDLRLARAGRDAAAARDDHGPADEPQLHPRSAAWPPTCPTAGATPRCASSTSSSPGSRSTRC